MKHTALILSLALLAGCSREESHSRSFRFLEVDGVSRATAILDGVAFAFDPSVRVHFGLDVGIVEISNDGDPSQVWTVNDHPFGIDEGVLFLEETRYGRVRPGDRVRVAADGVSVNGESRGALP